MNMLVLVVFCASSLVAFAELDRFKIVFKSIDPFLDLFILYLGNSILLFTPKEEK